MEKLTRKSPRLSVAMASLMAIILLVAVLVTTHIGRVAARGTDNEPTHAQAIVNKYLAILNAGMASGTCDFSALTTVYAPNAIVRATSGPFSPGGPFGPGGSLGQQEFDGVNAIIGFYTELCHIVSGEGVAQWTQDAAFLLSPTVLDSYEHASFNGVVGGHCEHVFTISGNRIVSLDWSVYG
jgi:hypothetical protein